MPSERVQRRIDRLLDDVEAAADAHDWDQVIEVAAAALALDASNEDALAFSEMAKQARAASASGSPSATDHAPNSTPDVAPLPSAGEGRGDPSPEGPTSFANDRHQVSEFLGEGGKKRVYQAHDTLLDREVAFALIKTEGFDQTSTERISREAQAMGRLGVHPNIVAVLDLGQEDDGSPYMVKATGADTALIPSSPTRYEGRPPVVARAGGTTATRKQGRHGGLPLRP